MQKHYKRKNDKGTAYIEINELAFEDSIRGKSALNNNAIEAVASMSTTRSHPHTTYITSESVRPLPKAPQ